MLRLPSPAPLVGDVGADPAVHVGVGEDQVLAVGPVVAERLQRVDGVPERAQRVLRHLHLGDVHPAGRGGHVPDVAGSAGLRGAGVVDGVDAGRPDPDRAEEVGVPARGAELVGVDHLDALAGASVALAGHVVVAHHEVGVAGRRVGHQGGLAGGQRAAALVADDLRVRGHVRRLALGCGRLRRLLGHRGDAAAHPQPGRGRVRAVRAGLGVQLVGAGARASPGRPGSARRRSGPVRGSPPAARRG